MVFGIGSCDPRLATAHESTSTEPTHLFTTIHPSSNFSSTCLNTTLPIVEQQENRLGEALLHSFAESPNKSATIIQNNPSGQVYAAAGPEQPRQVQGAGRMRSSIACIRCRRSKVKCVNNGVGTTCRSCENSGRDCQYPSPVAGGSRRRDSISGRADVYGDAERRQRPRKSTATYTSNPMTGPSDSPRPLLDALDPRLLTPAVWQELFDVSEGALRRLASCCLCKLERSTTISSETGPFQSSSLSQRHLLTIVPRYSKFTTLQTCHFCIPQRFSNPYGLPHCPRRLVMACR